MLSFRIKEILNDSIIGSIGDLKNMTSLDLAVPNEILDIIIANLDEKDLQNLIEVGDERIKHWANKRLEKLLLLSGK